MDRDAWGHFGKEDGPELWYRTPSGRKRYVHFDNLAEGRVWISRNYRRIRPVAGSWQLLSFHDIARGRAAKLYAPAPQRRIADV